MSVMKSKRELYKTAIVNIHWHQKYPFETVVAVKLADLAYADRADPVYKVSRTADFKEYTYMFESELKDFCL